MGGFFYKPINVARVASFLRQKSLAMRVHQRTVGGPALLLRGPAYSIQCVLVDYTTRHSPYAVSNLCAGF